jgi:very-short-patch-repair endonuclease
MPTRRSTPKLIQRARELRLEQTSAESILWSHLRAHRLNGIGFRRQHAIGPFIVDFCAPRQKLIIEVDGSPHLVQVEKDLDRSTFLESNGYRILRFWNSEVMTNITAVLRVISDSMKSPEP